MKKLLCCVVLGVVMSAVIGAGYAFGEYYDDNSGDSWEDAYIIDSAEDFELMINRGNYDSGNYYKIGADFEINRRSSATYNYFSGHLDGQNHTIAVNITSTSLTDSSSLFTMIDSDGTAIKDLNVTGSISARAFAAAIAYQLLSGTIENCTFSGNISVTDSSLNTMAGGIAVMAMGGSIEGCKVLSGSTISSKSTMGAIGGIVGEVLPNTETISITNCTSQATLEGNTMFKGGIAGLNGGGRGSLNLSGNIWPSRYTEVGDGTSYSTPASPTPSAPVQEYTELPPATIQPADLTADSLDQIAQILSLDGELHTIDTANVSSPEEPTQAMRDYAANDNTNLIGKLGVLTVPSEGWYIFKVTLGDELWELVQSQDVSGYKFYGLNDSEASDAQVKSAFILNGLLNTWELLTMSGRKMDKFGVREFFMVGFFNSSQPLSLFIAKTVLALLTGGLSGCNAGIAGALGAVVLVWFIRKRRR